MPPPKVSKTLGTRQVGPLSHLYSILCWKDADKRSTRKLFGGERNIKPHNDYQSCHIICLP